MKKKYICLGLLSPGLLSCLQIKDTIYIVSCKFKIRVISLISNLKINDQINVKSWGFLLIDDLQTPHRERADDEKKKSR